MGSHCGWAAEEAVVGASVTLAVVVGFAVLEVEGLAFVVAVEPVTAELSEPPRSAVLLVFPVDVVDLDVNVDVVGRIVSGAEVGVEVWSDAEDESARPVVVSMEATALWMATGEPGPGDRLSWYPTAATDNSPNPQANPRVAVMPTPNPGRRDTAPDWRFEPDGGGHAAGAAGGGGRGGGGGGGLSTKMLLRFRGPETRSFLQVVGRYQAERAGYFR